MTHIINEISALLNNYTDKEKLFKSRYLQRNINEPFVLTNRSINADELKIYFPEPNSYFIETFLEVNAFKKLKTNIVIEKHQRYTPTFIHSHDFFEMIYVWEGHCTNAVENTTLEMEKGDICILSPGVCHSMSVFDDSIIINILIKKSTFNDTFFSIMAEESILSVFFSKLLYSKDCENYILFNTKEDTDIKHACASLVKEGLFTEEDSYSDLLLVHQLIVIFGLLLRKYASSAKTSVDKHIQSSLIINILQYIQANYKTATLDETARKFGYTPSYMSKLIKNSTGNSFSNFIGVLRYQKARTMLRKTDIPISKICELTGYGSNEHFHRIFKKMSGQTPKSYRNSCRTEKNKLITQ